MANYLTICLIARDETSYLEEFVRFHYLIGVDKFYIFDNESSISIKNTLKEWIEKNIVIVIEYPGNGRQMQAYDYCLKNFGSTTKYLGFIDADEFIVPKASDNIPEILNNWEKDCQDRGIKPGGYALNWRIFGSNGHQKKPEGLLIENYTKASPRNWIENRHIKSIVLTEKTIRTNYNPHCFQYQSGYSAISEDFKVVPNAWTDHCAEKMQLNHYFCKSLEEFKLKISKPRCDTIKYPARPLSDFYKFDQVSIEDDPSALRFLNKVKDFRW